MSILSYIALSSLGNITGNFEGEEVPDRARGPVSKGDSWVFMQSLVSEKFP